MSDLPELQSRTDMDAAAYLPLTPTHGFWLRFLEPWLAPDEDSRGRVARALAKFFVVPFAPLTPLDLEYQTYLYLVFHRTWVSRIVHLAVFPLINLALMVALASVTLGSAHPEVHAANPFMWNLAGVFALGLVALYVGLAWRARSVALGVTSVAMVAGLWAAANAIYGLTFTLDASARSFLAPTPLELNPWIWLLAFSMIVTASHVREPEIPPRVIENDRWTPMDEFLHGPEDARYDASESGVRYVALGGQFVWGTFAELLGAQRLMPIAALQLMWWMGFAPELREKLSAPAMRALEQGQPALDYVGHGGGTLLHAPEPAPRMLPANGELV